VFGRKRSKGDEPRNNPSGEERERLEDLFAVHVPLRRDELPKRRPRGRAALLHPGDGPEPPR